jgi:hypothetical protein
MRGTPVDEDWARPVYRGLARAAVRQQDAAWAAALIPKLGTAPDATLVESLYGVFDPAQLADGIERALRAEPARAAELVRLLGPGTVPWPAGLSRAVLDAVEVLARAREPVSGLDAVCRMAGLGLPVGAVVAVADLAERLATESARTGKPDAYRVRPLIQLSDILRFRHDMTEEFA